MILLSTMWGSLGGNVYLRTKLKVSVENGQFSGHLNFFFEKKKAFTHINKNFVLKKKKHFSFFWNKFFKKFHKFFIGEKVFEILKKNFPKKTFFSKKQSSCLSGKNSFFTPKTSVFCQKLSVR